MTRGGKDKAPKETVICRYCLAGRITLLDKVFDCPACFGKGSITEGEHSPLTDALIENSVLKDAIQRYESFLVRLASNISSLDYLHDLRDKSGQIQGKRVIEGLIYISSLIINAVEKLSKNSKSYDELAEYFKLVR